MISSTVTGNVGQDPELRTTKGGTSVCNISIGSRIDNDNTQWVNVTFWGKSAEIIANLITKGSKLAVSGKMSMRTYEKINGDFGASLELEARDFEFMSSKKQSNPDEEEF